MNIKVYDLNGIIQLQINSIESSLEIDLSFLPTGTYFFSVIQNGKKTVRKLILVN